MIYLNAPDLEEVAFQAFKAVKVPEKHARTVAKHLVENNILGHHSHGVIRIISYVDFIKKGTLIPDAEPEIAEESMTTAQVDGNWSFGQVAATFATETVIKKAKSAGIACASVRNLSHLGRAGYYAEKMADEGLASIIFVASGGYGTAQAPFGGTKPRLSTHPIAMGFPFQPEGPFLADFATTAVAEGKLRVYRARGEKIKEGWILDAQGNPSTDPNDFYNGGTLLSFGGTEGHKGYSLAFMVDLFGSLLSQGGTPGQKAKQYSNTSFFIGIDVEKFAPLEKLKQDAETMVDFIKDVPLIDESKPVLYPGENEAKARKSGKGKRIGVEEGTWDGIVAILRENALGDFADSLDLSDHE
jgi:LDH2 family malate/lactate/ureidoglycolate dehydrogenase